MPKQPSRPGKTAIIGGVVVIAIVAIGGLLVITDSRDDVAPPVQPVVKAKIPQGQGGVIDYGKIKDTRELDSMMKDRKEEYGVQDSVDMIVTSDESIKVGERTVSMEEILDKVRLQQGGVVEKNLEWGKGSENKNGKDKEGFGIYVVQPGDNIWNIHFRLLKEFFEKRGVDLPPMSDELSPNGTSSGVGKILKFSENMVYIFNLESRNLDNNIHLIHPLSKVIVYRMDDVFALLEQIDFNKVSLIRFDGETLWIPAEN